MKRILKMIFFLVLLAGTIASGVSAVMTLVPDSSASKASMLGYKSHCSFTPISTIILVIMTLIFGLISVRTNKERPFRL